jgi:hypothetical protein
VHDGTFGGVEMLCILFVMVVTRMCKFANIRAVYLKWVL